MSVESIAIALHHSRSRGTARNVLIGIANHDGDGGSWPSLRTLRKYAGGVVESSVRDALRELERLGEISTVIQGGGSDKARASRSGPNLYRFLLRCPDTCDRSPQHRDIATTDEPIRGLG